MKSLRKNKKGVSDVIAVLLMIAIAVAASLIAYAWVMGYLGHTTSITGDAIQIQSMYTDGTTNLYVYVQNVGTAPVTLSSVYVNGVLAAAPTFTYPGGTAPLQINQTATVTTALPVGFSSTTAVDVKVVCSSGTFIEASEIVPVS